MWVVIAEYDDEYLGVFSSMESAKKACNKHSWNRFGRALVDWETYYKRPGSPSPNEKCGDYGLFWDCIET